MGWHLDDVTHYIAAIIYNYVFAQIIELYL